MAKYKVKFIVEVEDEDDEWMLDNDNDTIARDGIDNMVSSAWEILTQADKWDYLDSATCEGKQVIGCYLSGSESSNE